jgi:hypothetical protein
MANNVYEGGIPSSAGKNLFPSVLTEGEGSSVPEDNTSPFDTPSQSGPATFNGKSNTDSFHYDGEYSTGLNPQALDVRSEFLGLTPKMTIVNPNDIKNDC